MKERTHHLLLYVWHDGESNFYLVLCLHQKSFFFFLTSLLEYNCFTMVCQFLLYNKVNQLYIYICSHISSLLCLSPTLPIPPLQVVTKHRADLPVLCGCFPLAICFTLEIFERPIYTILTSELLDLLIISITFCCTSTHPKFVAIKQQLYFSLLFCGLENGAGLSWMF